MGYLLQINCSARLSGSSSRQLSSHFVKAWRNANPGSKIVTRDLAVETVPHISETTIDAFYTPGTEYTPEMHLNSEYSNALISEFVDSSAVVIATPMYNFSIPSSLKAYFDHLARVDHTFRFTEEGPQGLVKNKPVITIVTRGSVFDSERGNHVEPYLRTYFSFIGISNLKFIVAEGLSIPHSAANSVESAKHHLEKVAKESVSVKGI